MPNNINIGNYNFETLKTPRIQDYGSIYAAVGNALNQKYYQNRQAYINNIANPLSQMKATVRGQKVLDNERSKIIEAANQFKEQDNWFEADDYIFTQTENILTNEGLKAVQNDYALEQQFREELKKSDWDTQNQQAFMLRSLLQSKEIEYDAETNTVKSGGFNPVQIGKKFDVQSYQKDILDILSKAKADKVSWENLVTNPDAIRQYGLDVATGFDGEKLASHFIKTGGSKEGITEEQIMSYAMSLLKSNPDYTNYLQTIWQNQDVLKRFVKDDSTKGGHLRDYTLEDYLPLFGNNIMPFVMNGLGININELGSISNDGKWITSSNVSNTAKELISSLNEKYDINIIDILQNKIEMPAELIQVGLTKYLDKAFSNYVIGVLGNTNNIDDIDRDAWTQNILANQFINNNIQSLANTAAGLYSYQDISQTIDLITNPAYTAYVKAKAKGKQEELAELQRYAPTLDTLSGFQINENSVTENLSRQNEITDKMKELENSMNQMFSANELAILGLKPTDGNLIKSISYPIAEKLIDNSILDDDSKIALKSKLLEIQTKQRQYNNLEAERRSNEIQLNAIFDTWNKYRDKIEGGIGWYRVNDNFAKLILDNRIHNYDEFIDYINSNYKEYYDNRTGGTFYKTTNKESNNPEVLNKIPDREEFDSILSNAADNVSNRYRKAIADKPLEFTAVRSVISNPSPYQEQYMANAIENWKIGAGNISIVQTPTGKGIGMTGTELAKYLDFDSMPTSVTTNSKGVSITRNNTAQRNTTPIPGKELGLDYDIYSTSIKPIANGIAAKQGRQEYAITLYDASGAARGNIIISEQLNREVIGRQILDNYRNIKPYATIGGESLARSAGMIESQYVNGFMDFDTTGSYNSPAVNNIKELQEAVDKLGTVEYNLNIREPLQDSIDGNSRKIRIGKSTNGYYIEDIGGLEYPDGSIHYGEFAYSIIPNSLDVIEGITSNNRRYYSTVNEALAPIAEYILTQQGRWLDYIESMNQARMQQIKNSNIGY